MGGCLITLSAPGAKRDKNARTTREGGAKMSDFITGLPNQLTSSDYTNVNKLKDTINNTDYSKATDEELMEACKSFEAYYTVLKILNQILLNCILDLSLELLAQKTQVNHPRKMLDYHI